MSLKSLNLTGFRGLLPESFEFNSNTNIIVGQNGSGKTSILEAVAILARLESFRTNELESVIATNQQRAQIIGYLEGRQEVPTVLGVELSRTARKRTYKNNQLVNKVKDYLGDLAVVIFTPDDLEIVKGGPESRRALLDDAIVSLTPSWIRSKTDYDSALKHRNRLLKDIQVKGTGEHELLNLEIWDDRVAKAGELLARAREQVVDYLGPQVQSSYEALSGNQRVELSYKRSWSGSLEASLGNSREIDLRLGITSVGPHRDDLAISLNGLTSRSQASQGEQRSIVLSIKLAMARLIGSLRAQASMTAPTLLLDDVFSELDQFRIANFLDILPTSQTIITTTSLDMARDYGGNTIYLEKP